MNKSVGMVSSENPQSGFCREPAVQGNENVCEKPYTMECHFREFTLDTVKAILPRLYDLAVREQAIVLDLAEITFWDPAALLWFSLCLKNMIDQGKSVRIKLPQPNSCNHGVSTDPAMKATKQSAGFLRRWRYDLVLRRIGELENLLVPSQADYFDPGQEQYYTARMTHDGCGGVHEMMSTSLLPFFDFAALERADVGAAVVNDQLVGAESEAFSLRISRSAVNGRIRDLREAAIAGVLAKSCSISAQNADLFVRKIVGEALDNMERHPNASFGMMAINKSVKEGVLCLAVVDNGESICKTMLPVYNQARSGAYDYDSVLASSKLAADVLDYSTYPEVSSKPNGSGMGLYYMKRHVLDSFGGRLQILTSGVLCEYSSAGANGLPESRSWPHEWSGNLIRIEIPLENRCD